MRYPHLKHRWAIIDVWHCEYTQSKMYCTQVTYQCQSPDCVETKQKNLDGHIPMEALGKLAPNATCHG